MISPKAKRIKKYSPKIYQKPKKELFKISRPVIAISFVRYKNYL